MTTQKNTPTVEAAEVPNKHLDCSINDNQFAGLNGLNTSLGGTFTLPASDGNASVYTKTLAMLKGENHHQTENFSYISYADFVDKVENPQQLKDAGSLKATKGSANICAPHDGKAKTQEAALANDNYTILWADVDKNNHNLTTHTARLKDAGISSFAIHATQSSKPTDKRWRVVVEIAEGISFARWHMLQTHLMNITEGGSESLPAQQIMYMPAKSKYTEHYEFFVSKGEPLDVTNSDFAKAAFAYQKEQDEKALADAEKASMAVKPKYVTPDGQKSPIVLFYEAYGESVLPWVNAKGCKQVSKYRYVHPDSESGTGGITITKDDKKYFSYHKSDSLSDGKGHDAFDLYVEWHHGGNFDAAVKAIAEDMDKDANDARRLEHRQKEQRLRDAQPSVNFEVVEQDLKAPEQPKDKRNQERIYNIIKDTAMGRRAKDLAQMVEMPTDTVCLAGLGVISSMVAGSRAINRRGGYSKVPAGLYIAVEQPPSTGKSSIIDGFRNPILKHLIEANKRHVAQVKEAAKEAGEEEPKFVQCLNLFQSNATPEAMEAIVDNNDGLFSIVGDEQAAIETLLGLTYGDKGSNNNGFILNGFAGELFNSARVTRKGFNGMLYGSITVMAQEGTARKIVQGSNGQGVVERFLLWNEPNLLGTRSRAFHELTTEEEYSQIASNLVKLTLEQYKKESGGLDNLASLNLTEDGYKAIEALQSEVEPLLADDGRYSHPLLRGAAGKVDMQVMKIAATLHMADECLELATPDTSFWQPHYIIKDKYVTMAIDVVRITLEQLIHTLEVNGIIGRDSYMDALADYLEGKHKPLTARAIAQSQKNRPIFKDTGSPTKHINEALQRLVDIEVVTATQETIGGKPQTVYKLH